MKLKSQKYTPWRYTASVYRIGGGSKWYYGNFSLGVHVDSHPRFTNLAISFVLFEVFISRNRSYIQEYEATNGMHVSLVQHPGDQSKSN